QDQIGSRSPLGARQNRPLGQRARASKRRTLACVSVVEGPVPPSGYGKFRATLRLSVGRQSSWLASPRQGGAAASEVGAVPDPRQPFIRSGRFRGKNPCPLIGTLVAKSARLLESGTKRYL